MESKAEKKGITAYFYAGLAILFWSTISTAFKLSLRYQTPAQLLLGAAFCSLLVFILVIILQGKAGLLLKGSRRELVSSAILGFLNPFLYYTVLLEAYDRLPAQEAQALNYIWAVMLVVLAIPILKQKPGFRDLSGVLVSFFGAVIIALRGNFKNLRFDEPVGVSLALISTLIWALFWLLNVKDKRDQVVKLFWAFIFGFMYILIFSFITGQLELPSLKAVAGEAYVGVFEMGITFMFWLMTLQKATSTARVTNLIFITPFISLVIINRILHETIAVSTLVGLILIISGILWQQTARKISSSTS